MKVGSHPPRGVMARGLPPGEVVLPDLWLLAMWRTV